MGKNRKSKRQLIRDEKRAKKRGIELAAGAEDEEHESLDTKRRRRDDYEPTADFIPLDDDAENNVDANFVIDLVGKKKKKEKANDGGQEDGLEGVGAGGGGSHFEREFFGMLADQEQEYFRRADELLELNDFPSEEERHIFLQNVYKEARGKELKLASSQSCSRLMERLILLSSTKQKKRIYDAFAGHFISLITHRFAGHCCEKLFLQSAPVVTRELKGETVDEDQDREEEEEKEEEEENPPESLKLSMEDLLLLTLDELEEHLSFLLSDRYGSHALRVLLVVLSGRPLDQAGTKSLLQGKNKEHVTVEGAAALMTNELWTQPRAVPSSFTAAIQKIIGDSIVGLDSTSLRVLAKHPTGNPTLQLLLDLELSLAPKGDKKKAKKGDEEEKDVAPPAAETLLDKLIPGAPASFADEKSSACEFVNSMMYDPIGSRLLETLITHCPGKIFKGLLANIFAPRIQSLLRNDIASYPAIRVLNRLSKEDLADAVKKCLPEIPSFIEKGRLNVVKTLFERCGVRNATAELSSLLQALTAACNNNWKHIVPKLCPLEEEPQPSKDDAKEKKFQPAEAKNKSALLSHGSQVVLAMLEISGQTSKAIQNSLLGLKPDQLMRLATSSAATANIINKALATPPQLPHFHKLLVAGLSQNIVDIALSQHGNPIACAIIACPSKGEANIPIVPFHLKENIMGQLALREASLRETWLGRNVWRTWKGDLYGRKRFDWVRWAKETDPEEMRIAAVPKSKKLEEIKKAEIRKNEDEQEEQPEEEEEEKEGEDVKMEDEEDTKMEENGVKDQKEKKKKRKRDGKEKEEKKKNKKKKEKKGDEEGDKMEIDE